MENNSESVRKKTRASDEKKDRETEGLIRSRTEKREKNDKR